MNEWQSFKFKIFVVDSFRNLVRDIRGKSTKGKFRNCDFHLSTPVVCLLMTAHRN